MNWGNKLLVAFLAFGVMMGYLVYRALSTDFQLVEKDYYKNELRYQQVIDGNNRANALSSPIRLSQQDHDIVLQMPAEMSGKKISGSVQFYCAYDKSKDERFELLPGNSGLQVFRKDAVFPGNYTVRVNWTYEDKNYYAEQYLTVR